MLDVTLFSDPRFSAASGAVTITFFALFGFIFLITQYFQFVRGYGTLSTGARILPVALSIAVPRSSARMLAPRIGTKAVVTTGLVDVRHGVPGGSRRSPVDTSYASVIVPQMVLMGLGMGLISDAGHGVDHAGAAAARAGVGSAVNDATRELGGTLGVAVVGSLFASMYADHLADGAFGRLPGRALAQAQDSVGAALAIGGGNPRLVVAMQDAFMAGLSTVLVDRDAVPRRCPRSRWSGCPGPGGGRPGARRRRPLTVTHRSPARPEGVH